jgi:hypothetical protein
MSSQEIIQNIKQIDIKTIKEHILSNISTSSNTITVYHFIIGSKSYEQDFSIDPLLQTFRPRNHECPKIVENLLFNPDLQISPDILKNELKLYEDITIRQVLFLIDPAYMKNPIPVGLISVINGLPLDLTIEHNLENINIKSILEPIIVPCDITEKHVLELIKTLEMFRSIYPIIINIMDCSSNTCLNIYSDSIGSITNWLYITKPKCLIDDTELQYIPMLTFENSCADAVSESPDSLFTSNKLNVRWINWKDDSMIIKDINYDMYTNCIYTKNFYEFLVRIYKVETFEYSLFLINKLWGITTYTSNHTINYRQNVGSRFNTSQDININFSKLTFEEFAKYWNCKEFRDLPPFNYDYDFIIFCKFIDNFIKKYSNGIGYSYLGLNPSIVDFLKVEALEIFTTLANYFIRDKKYLSDDYKTVSRDSIKKYLLENGNNL